MTGQPIILISDVKSFEWERFDEANQQFGFDIQYVKECLLPKTVPSLKGFRVLAVSCNDTIDETTMEILKKNGVELIAIRRSGVHNVDLKAADQKIHVVRIPEYSPNQVAERTLALLQNLNSKTSRDYVGTAGANTVNLELLGLKVYGKNCGVIGTGKVGKCLIPILKSLKLNVLAYDPHPETFLGNTMDFRYVKLNELYAQSDVILLNCPLSRETESMINAGSISKMKKGVLLINTGSGRLVKVKEVIQALKSGRIGGVSLESYEEEHEYYANETLKNIRQFLAGGPLPNEICHACGTDGCKKKLNQRCF